jgi:hypothetical protein
MRRFSLACALLACLAWPARAQEKPAGAGSNSPDCRTIVKAASTHTGGHGFTTDTTTACRYDKTASKATCTNTYQDSHGTKTTSVSVTTYASLTDMIAEVTVVPPLRRSLRTDSTIKGPRGTTTSTVVNSYDRQHRHVEEAGTASAGQKSTTTYTSWDAAGRPTAGRTVHPGVTTALAISYNDATRTQTTTSTGGGLRMTCSMQFDANGNQLSTRCLGSAASSSNATTRTTATERICR